LLVDRITPATHPLNGLTGIVYKHGENVIYVKFDSREGIDMVCPDFLTSNILTKEANDLLNIKTKSLT
jgi:hypothetical protein